MSEEPVREKPPRIKVSVEMADLSSKQRGAVLGLIKDMGFVPEEISEIAVRIPEGELAGEDGRGGRRQKRK